MKIGNWNDRTNVETAINDDEAEARIHAALMTPASLLGRQIAREEFARISPKDIGRNAVGDPARRFPHRILSQMGVARRGLHAAVPQ